MGSGSFEVSGKANHEVEGRLSCRAAFYAGLTLIFVGTWVAASGQEKAREEINENVGKIRANIETITKNLRSIEDNLKAGEKNLMMIEQEIATKKKAREDVAKDIDRSENAFAETKRSEKEFREGLEKDLVLVETTRRDIDITKKRLGQLEENLKILQENVEIDQENIGKISKAREVWEKNSKSYRAAAAELDQLRKELEGQLKSQRGMFERNTAEKNRWLKSLNAQKKDLEEIEMELKKLDTAKRQMPKS